MLVPVAQAFRHRAGFTANVGAFARSLSQPAGVLLLTGNASRSGFESANPGVAATLLNAAEQAWAAAPDTDLRVRFDTMFAACEQVVESFETEGDEATVGWLTAACFTSGQIVARWLGGDEVWLVSTRGAFRRTEGHTLHHREKTTLVPNVVTKGFGVAYGDIRAEGLPEPWTAAPGDRLALLSKSVVESLSNEKIVALVRHGDSTAAAAALVAAASDAPYAVAIIAQL